MDDNLPARLRAHAESMHSEGWYTQAATVAEAADEIERLGKQCEDLLRHEREVERLRAAKCAVSVLWGMIMTDIVERLRQGIERGDEGDAEAAMDKAADEIERLRAEVELWKDRCGALDRDFRATLDAPCPHCGA